MARHRRRILRHAFTLGLIWIFMLPTAATGQSFSFSTLIRTEFAIEGLTGDDAGNLYTIDRGPSRCVVWRITLTTGSSVEVGFIATPCSPSGLAFNQSGDLFIADGSQVYTLTPNESSPPMATVFAMGVPGTNGLAFDRDGNLWTADGTQGLGRVWKVTPAGVVTEVFRIQPMRNADAVGRQTATFPTGNAQDLVGNGLAFNEEGDLFVADTARGAIWKAEFDQEGGLQTRTGCDVTFTANTLCLNAIFVIHPLLDGSDGIALDLAGNIWSAANERNAIVVVDPNGHVEEVFRNPVDPGTVRRNAGPLEFPTSPFLSKLKFCTANSDGNRRDNSPPTAGEIAPAGPFRGKISCLDQRLRSAGLPLP